MKMTPQQRKNWLLEMWLITSGQIPDEYPLYAPKNNKKFIKHEWLWMTVTLLAIALAVYVVIIFDVL